MLTLKSSRRQVISSSLHPSLQHRQPRFTVSAGRQSSAKEKCIFNVARDLSSPSADVAAEAEVGSCCTNAAATRKLVNTWPGGLYCPDIAIRVSELSLSYVVLIRYCTGIAWTSPRTDHMASTIQQSLPQACCAF